MDTAQWRAWAGRMMDSVGLYPQAKQVYRVYRRAPAHVRRRFGPATVEIAGAAVKFPTPTYRIYQWVTDIPERDLIAWLLYELEDDDVIWDIGAHIGMFAFPAAALASDGEVVAFEPGPRNLRYLRETATMNNFDTMTVEPIALGAADGTVRLDAHENSSTNTTTTSVDEGHKVSIQRGESLVHSGNTPSPTVVKIDVEGDEIDVLDGLGSVLTDCRLVICEVHHTHGVSITAVEDAFEGHNLGCRTIRTGNATAHVVARPA